MLAVDTDVCHGQVELTRQGRSKPPPPPPKYAITLAADLMPFSLDGQHSLSLVLSLSLSLSLSPSLSLSF